MPSPPRTSARSVSASGSVPSAAPGSSSKPCLSISSAGTCRRTPASAHISRHPAHRLVGPARGAAGEHGDGLRRAQGSALRAACSRSSCAPARPASASHTKLSRLPAGPGQPGGGEAEHRQPELLAREAAHLDQRSPPVVGRAHHAAAAHALAADLELGLDQGEQVEPLGRRAHHRGQHLGQRDERHVDHHQVGRLRQLSRLELPRVAPLDHGHPRVLAQPPAQLAVSYVQRGDAGSTALQQAVGESARRGAHVQAGSAGGVDPEGVERVGELDAAAADVGRRGLDLDRDVVGHQLPGLAAGRRSEPRCTWPAITAAAARERDSYRPRSASRVSRRRRATGGA